MTIRSLARAPAYSRGAHPRDPTGATDRCGATSATNSALTCPAVLAWNCERERRERVVRGQEAGRKRNSRGETYGAAPNSEIYVLINVKQIAIADLARFKQPRPAAAFHPFFSPVAREHRRRPAATQTLRHEAADVYAAKHSPQLCKTYVTAAESNGA